MDTQLWVKLFQRYFYKDDSGTILPTMFDMLLNIETKPSYVEHSSYIGIIRFPWGQKSHSFIFQYSRKGRTSG